MPSHHSSASTPNLTNATMGAKHETQLYDPRVVLGAELDHGGVCQGSMIVPIDFKSNPIVIDQRDFVINQETGRPQIDLYVTSDKQLKYQPAIDFVVKSLTPMWPNFSADDIVLHALKVSSGIAEQPIGRDQAEQGARGRCMDSRIQTALGDPQGKNIFVVSFENAISLEARDLSCLHRSWHAKHADVFVNENGEMPIDVAGIFVQTVVGGKSQESLAFSDGVTLPKKYVEKSRETQYQVTAGSIMEKEMGVSGTNWHEQFVGYSRDYLLRIGVDRIPLAIV